MCDDIERREPFRRAEEIAEALSPCSGEGTGRGAQRASNPRSCGLAPSRYCRPPDPGAVAGASGRKRPRGRNMCSGAEESMEKAVGDIRNDQASSSHPSSTPTSSSSSGPPSSRKGPDRRVDVRCKKSRTRKPEAARRSDGTTPGVKSAKKRVKRPKESTINDGMSPGESISSAHHLEVVADTNAGPALSACEGDEHTRVGLVAVQKALAP